MSTARRTTRRGFTLVEAVATITILAVVSMTASRIIFAAADAYAGEATRAELTLDLSAAMERIAGELRAIPSRDASPGTPWIDVATASGVTFGNGSRLALVSDRLELTIEGGPARALLEDVAAFELTYFDEAGQPINAPVAGAARDTIRRIGVSVTRGKHGVVEQLRTRVYIRSAAAGGGA
jgi:prepilin-type N-terminal cleavage/methylation domain-containing protein